MSSASSTRLVAVLGFLAVALVAWLALTLFRREGTAGRVEGAEVSLPAEKTTPQPAAALVETDGRIPPTTRAIPERVDVGLEGPTSAELADAIWVGGRVIFPEGTPGDESVVVVAAGREFGSKKLHRASIAPDGSFRVAFASKTKKASLRLDARYLFLEESKELKLDESISDVILAPVLGGGFRGRVKLDPAAQRFASDLVGATVTVWGWKQGLSRSRTKSAKLDAELGFEVGGLDPAISWHIGCTVKGFATATSESASVVAASFQPVELVLARGASVSGTVRDESGAPVAGARVHTDARGRSASLERSVDPSSDEAGRYAYADLRAGEARFVVTNKGYVSSILEPLTLAAGEERSNVDVTLSRGSSIAGVARFSDGQPAVDVTVTAKPNQEEELPHGVWFDRDDPSAKTDQDGKFVITGLRAGAHAVSARSAPRNAENVPTDAKRAPRVRFEDRRENVAAGTTDLLLTLESGTPLHGRVVDDTGAPVQNFKVTLSRQGANPWETTGRREVSSKTNDGSFELPGVGDGSWEVVAKTKDGGASDALVVELPGEAHPLELVLARPARLRGTILDPASTPIAGATVRIDRDDHQFRYFANENDAQKSDERGAFEAPAKPGLVRVSAVHSNWAPSPSQVVNLAPGVPAPPITLQLRRGGTITGRVLDREGKPLSGRQLNAWDGSSSLDRTSDSEGRFRFEHVAPGSVRLTVQPSEAELAATLDEKGQPDWVAAQLPNGSKQVTVIDGATVDVVLGGAAKDALRVTGLVSARAPIPRAKLQFFGPTHTEFSESRAATSDENGRYEVHLPGPGKYSVNLNREDGGHLGVQVEVPPGPSFVFDIALPAGSIRGRVLDTAGAPAIGVQVYGDRQHGPESRSEAEQGFFVSVTTQSDGTFNLEALAAGTYTVFAMDVQHYGGRSPSATRGRAKLDGIVLAEGATVDGLVIRFPVTGEVKGTVRSSSGALVANASVLARAVGDDTDLGGFARTGSSGSYRMDGLAAGTYTLFARNDTESSSESQKFVVTERGSVEVNLVLAPSNRLVSLCEDAQGNVISASFVLRDANRRVWSDFGMNAPPAEGSEPGVPKFGRRFDHIPDGEYSIQASASSKTSAQERVTLKGGVTREIRLRLQE